MRGIIKDTIAILNSAERKKMLLLMMLNLVFNILDIAFLSSLLVIVQLYTDPAKVKVFSFVPAWLADQRSIWPIGIFFVLFALKNLGSFLVFQYQCKFRHQVILRISKNNLLQYLEGNYNDHVNIDSSVHFAQVNLQPAEFCQYVMEGLQQIFAEWTLIGLTVIAVLLFNAKLFLLLLLVLLPPVIITAWLTKRKTLAAKAGIATRRETAWQHLEESIAGFVESNVYNKHGFFVGRYHRSHQALNKHLSTLQAVQGAPSRMAEVFAVFGLLVLISISHFSGMAQGVHFVTLGAFLAAAYKIIPGIARILNINGQIRTYAFTTKDLLKKKRKATPTKGDAKVEKITSITASNISFRYGQLEILKEVDLHIEAGNFLGIQGSSGKGKTTLLNIILGFLKPENGDVFFNGKRTNIAERKNYWEKIAYVKQQPFIIHDTILANITMDDENYDEEKLQQALCFSGLNEVVANLPKGTWSEVSEDGKNISGGQRQRISIARALYKDADLYILDEPFSELDEASEERLLGHFQ